MAFGVLDCWGWLMPPVSVVFACASLSGYVVSGGVLTVV